MNLFQELTSMFSRNQFVVKPPKGTDYFPLGIHKGNRRGSITKYPEVKLTTLKEVADYIATVNAQNIFQKIAVSGQNDVEADASNDTVTFIAGTGMTLTTDKEADSVTFTNSAPNVDQNLYETIAIQNSGGTTNINADNTTDTFTIKEGAGITLNEDAANQTVSVGVNEAELPVTRGMSSTINHLVANGQGDYRVRFFLTNLTTGSPNENDTIVDPQLIIFARQNAPKNQQGGMPWNLYYNQFTPALDPGYDAGLGLGSSTTGMHVLMEESVKDVLARQGQAGSLNSALGIAAYDVGQLKSFRMPLRMRVDNAGSSPGNGTVRIQLINAGSGASNSPDASVDANILPSTVYVYFRDTTLTTSKMGGPPFNLVWAGKDTTFAKFQNNGVAYTAGCDYVFSGNSGGDITRKYEIFIQDEIASLGRFSSLKVTDSRVVFEDLPTSDPVSKGVLWNDNGTLKISAG